MKKFYSKPGYDELRRRMFEEIARRRQNASEQINKEHLAIWRLILLSLQQTILLCYNFMNKDVDTNGIKSSEKN